MENISTLVIKLAGVIVAFVMAISAIYVWILPGFFHGYKTYSFLMVGIIGSALIGGYLSYQAANAVVSATNRFLLASICGVVVAAFVSLFALIIILNMRGS